ncbi:hypothetical protein CkaCkLH20_11505 [Colletotrichum karsti]|uniref:Uncharacterized protein n=1 Tax=Colletotrichum karsti TaxID=1095194 RepID=A0A9P6HTY6_9PEZI|nr:uncharacterized protein CkaCkLH20_11505 [Colletotrichum karsti]KAF9871088.1 hypothetical protein CkaCkLH20_11505 [Colletotrichum karsti]
MSPKKTSKESPSSSASPEPGSKRKAATKDEIKDEHEAAEPEPKKPKTATNSSVIEWLLTDEAFSLAFPSLPPGHGEIDWEAGHAQPQKTPPPEDAGKKKSNGEEQIPLLTYPDSSLTPFQNLTAALLLSKPISHRLGLRTINTLLNPPFGLRTLKDLDEAGFEGRRKVVWEARTQHKEKTAAQLGDLVQSVRDICGVEEDEDVEEMEGLRAQIKDLKTPEEAQKKVEKILTDGVKGIGPTGAGIFLRRVQERWEDVFPYADKRALEVAVQFKILEEGDGAEELAEKVDGDRAKFVRLLDVLVGIQLEKKTEEALKVAGVTK